MAALGPAPGAQGRAEQGSCSPGRHAGPLEPHCLVAGTSRDLREENVLHVFVSDMECIRKAGSRGSCPSSAPHGPAEKSPGSVTTEGLQGTVAEELAPQSCCGKALAVQWIRRCFCSDSGSQSPFFSFPLLPGPQCAIWVISI